MHDWLARSDWARRSPEFGALSMRELHVVTEYLPALPEQAWQVWLKLPAQSNILLPDRPGFLRHAALDWSHERLALTDVTSLSRFATWGLVLARAYRHIVAHAPQCAWLARPRVWFDLEGVMRIGFLRAEEAHVPPETMDQWPLCDERALVYVVASALVELADEVPWDSHIGKILARSLDRDPAQRYRSLGVLETVLQAAGAKHLPSTAPPRNTAWPFAELGIGFLAIDHRDTAHSYFRQAHRRNPSKAVDELLAFTAPTVSAAEPAPPPPLVPWSEARSAGKQLEAEHDFVRALALYKRAELVDVSDIAEHAIARARCRLALGDADAAVGLVRAVLARDPSRHEARAIEVRALLAVKLHTDALGAVDAWIATSADDGNAHYARGKALLGLRRFVEARDAFERACVLAPALVEAMWLRAAVEKSLARLRVAVGTPVPMASDLPPGDLRDALISGRLEDGIRLLREDSTPVAQLRLGDLLLYAARFEEAIAVFERIDDPAALAGKARALIDLGRTDEALVILETIGSDGFTAIRR